MKALVAAIVLLLILGGAGGSLYYMGLPPFARAVPAKAAGTPSRPAAATNAVPAGQPDPPPASPSASSGDSSSTAAASRRPHDAAPGAGTASAHPEGPVADRKIARLASIYEQMDADAASQVFAKLPDDLAVRILSRMDERQVGKLMAAFPPDRAAKLTRALAR